MTKVAIAISGVVKSSWNESLESLAKEYSLDVSEILTKYGGALDKPRAARPAKPKAPKVKCSGQSKNGAACPNNAMVEGLCKKHHDAPAGAEQQPVSEEDMNERVNKAVSECLGASGSEVVTGESEVVEQPKKRKAAPKKPKAPKLSVTPKPYTEDPSDDAEAMDLPKPHVHKRPKKQVKPVSIFDGVQLETGSDDETESVHGDIMANFSQELEDMLEADSDN